MCGVENSKVEAATDSLFGRGTTKCKYIGGRQRLICTIKLVLNRKQWGDMYIKAGERNFFASKNLERVLSEEQMPSL